MPRLQVLIADDEAPARFGLKKALAHPDATILEAGDGAEALALIRSHAPDLVFLDLNMPGLDGLNVLQELGPAARLTEIVVVTANDNLATAVECVRLGAADYIAKPYEVEQLRAIVRRVAQRLELQERIEDLESRLDERQAFGALVGVSRPMRQLFAQMTRAAQVSADILIRGETGTGKELIAREVHRLSPRAAGPFVAVNTSAIAESLAESELFGHVRGAFTGAESNRQGVFEQAHGGTLFLDEIGDMPTAAQTKILRALQEREVQPVGSSRSVHVDVRVITATHQDLEACMSAGEFRQDLFYRIKGIELHIPPLRTRREDVLLLARYFADRSVAVEPAPEFTPAAINALLAHSWPGNVRELQHAVTNALAFATDGRITESDLGLRPRAKESSPDAFADYRELPFSDAKAKLIEDFERAMIQSALEQHAGNVSAAARQLGIHRQNLQQKMAQLGIER
jgi:DNA-binding NtrC family response regulator